MRRFLVLLLLLLGTLPAWANYPQRIIAGIPSVTEMLFALGLQDQVVGVTTNCNYPPEAAKKEKVGGYTLNLEKIVSLKPDLIVLLEDAQRPEIEKLKKFGLPVYTINPKSVSDVMGSLISLGKVTGKQDKAERLVWAMKRRLWSAKAHDLPRLFHPPKVLVIVGLNPLIVAGGGTFIDDVVKYAGGENLARDLKGPYPQFNYERLMAEKPEDIIISEGMAKRSEFEKDQRWQSIRAKILFINADILSRPGPRVVDAVEQIAKFIHDKN